MQLPHERIRASSACHRDPWLPAGAGARLADGSRPEIPADGSRGARHRRLVHARGCRRPVRRPYRYVGLDGAVLDMHAFGTSALLQDVKNRFGFTRRPSLASPGRSWPSGTTAPAG